VRIANDLLETELNHLLPSAAVINPVSIVSQIKKKPNILGEKQEQRL